MNGPRALLVVALVVVAGACQCGPGVKCTTSGDCAAQQVCVQGFCRGFTGNDGGNGGGGGATGGGAANGGGTGGAQGGGSGDGGPSVCGDGVLSGNERCDDGNTTNFDGCNQICILEPNSRCPTPGQPCVSTIVCGDGLRTGTEQCDDRNMGSGDGCSATCTLEPGWACPTIGAACVAAQCGDGILAGFEECDDHNMASNDGCSSGCVVEEGFACPTIGAACVRTTCGNGVKEGIEQCDDQNHDLGDGCDVFCHAEPRCTNGTCQAVCGDGIRQAGEACDDGNVRAGDGCGPLCLVEAGYMCADITPTAQASLAIPIVYRDFRPNGTTGGHIDFENVIAAETGVVGPTIGSTGKPVYAGGAGTVTTHGQGPFDQWYRDTQGVNRTVVDRLVVTRDATGSYVFDSDNFFPLDGRGWQSDGSEPNQAGHNFNFTSELRYWFNFAGGESLDFRGDDDVFVFINGKLAVDLGGVHGPQSGAVTLDPATATSLGLTSGGVYEAIVFQAERHTTGSSYRLTLRGFNAPRSSCTFRCGDGVVTRYEVCDDGINDGRYGGCLPGCLGRGGYCGDSTVQADAGEACDDGQNLGGPGQCAPGCGAQSGCGDGQLDPSRGEECDDANHVNGDGCDATCHIELG
ncbi:MAG: DUF4215 domain-containing protein [Myxococcaceae bacterium]